MDRDTIVTLVLSRLGKREGQSYLVAQAQLELLHIITTKLERGALLPWFLLSDETALTLTANTRLAAALPVDFLREWDEFPISLYDATADVPYTELFKDDYDLNRSWEQSGSASSDSPRYSLVGTNYAVFPLLPVDTPARVVYYKKSDVTDNYNNVWCQYADDVLVAELGMVMARYLRSDLLDEFKQDRKESYSRLMTEDVARKNAAREAFRGN